MTTNGTAQKAYAQGGVPLCTRCRLHVGLYGIYSHELRTNVQVCCACLTPSERKSIETAGREFCPVDRNGGAK